MSKNCQEIAARAIAETAFTIVKRTFAHSSSDDHPVFRMKNLETEEIHSFLEVWAKESANIGLDRVKVIISSDARGDYPNEYLADPDLSITYYRNHNTDGLIYIETSPVSDEQGLRNIFTLRDVNFLDGSFDDIVDGFRVAEQIARSAWDHAASEGARTPAFVIESLLRALDALHPTETSLPVRRFARFCARVAEQRNDPKKNFGTEETEKVVGECLFELGLFPDALWASAGAGPKIKRRLVLNLHAADLVGPGNQDLDVEDLADQAKEYAFKDDEGILLPSDDLDRWRNLCSRYCLNPSRELRSEIPFAIFEQLFQKDTKGMLLGEKVETEIVERAPDRLSEFAKLDVRNGLDKKDQGEAERFLDVEATNEEDLPLRDLLTTGTLKRVQKIARPAITSISNPLLTLAEIAGTFREYLEGEDRSLAIRLSVGKRSSGEQPALSVFSFLFGATLRSLSESSRIDSEGFAFEIDEALFKQYPVPELRGDAGSGLEGPDDFPDENGLDELRWDPVPLEFQLVAESAGAGGKSEILDLDTSYQWFPPSMNLFVLFWLMSADLDAPSNEHVLQVPSEFRFDDWLGQAVSRTVSLKSLQLKSYPDEVCGHEICLQLQALQKKFRHEAAKNGLSVELLSGVFDEWLELADRFKLELVPSGNTDPRVDMFLSSDFVSKMGSGGRIMLQSHPLRLRWIANFLKESETLALKALSGDLQLNSENDTMYLSWIGNLSPHQQPALASDSDSTAIFAASEAAWTEQFVPVDRHKGEAADLELDITSLAEIGRQITTYLYSHPNKADGLSILISLPRGVSVPSRLVREFRKGEFKSLPIKVHVLAPSRHWPAIVEDFEKLHVEDRMSHADALFPPLQLQLHDLDRDETLDAILEGISCDIAIIPQFLSDEVQEEEDTKSHQHLEGGFSPLMDAPTAVFGGAGGGAITVSKLPKAPDRALEIWSTLVVRHRRTRPIAADMPKNTDYVQIKIDFRREAELFEAMHKVSHWVITLEKHITREQIENLDSRPDILTVKENVGVSGLYTLVVSSQAGRAYIIQRLERKLRGIVGQDGHENAQVAEKVFDESRKIAPSLALQAMGVSRVTEEMLGLVIARRVADERYPVPSEEAATVWLSLDDYSEWLGGANGTRADLCRITFSRVNENLKVDLLVVEGKLRQAYDAHGETQVARTVALFRDILPKNQSVEADEEKIDARIWRSMILEAIESAGPDAKQFSGYFKDHASGTSLMLPVEIREKFRKGDFELGSLQGLFSICNYLKTSPMKFRSSSAEPAVEVVESFKDIILALVEGEARLTDDRVHAEGKPAADEQSDADIDEKPEKEELAPDTEKTDDEEERPAGRSEHNVEKEMGKAVDRKRLPEDVLRARYQDVLDTLSEFGVAVTRPEDPDDCFVEGPASILYRIVPGQGVSPNNIYQKGDSLKLALKLSEEQEIRFSIHDGFINIDVPKKDADRFYVTAQELWKEWEHHPDRLSCPIGIDRTSELVSINFSSSNSPHLLIGGTTGSGKSEALNTILYGLTTHYDPEALRLLLIDPKGTELEAFEDSKHLEGRIGMDDEDAVEMLERAVDEMQWRYKRLKAEGVRSLTDYNKKVSYDQKIPWWLIVLDEYADLTSDPDAKKQIEASLKRLAQKARAAGIHVIIATQKPSSEVISTNLRSNLPAQLALRVKSGTESRVIMDELGAETLNGKGDAFLKSEGRLQRVQCAMYNPE